jgi:drug/metabolite transporter (DMT)-like permease
MNSGGITIALGALYGVTFILNVYFYLKLMEIAPLSFSVLFNSFGLLIPTLAGIFFWREQPKLLQLIGLMLMLLCLFLVAGVSKNDFGKINSKWITYGLTTLSLNGLAGVLQKTNQSFNNGLHIKEFLAIGFAMASLISLVMIVLYRYKTKQKVERLKSAKPLFMILGAGIGTAYGMQTLMGALYNLPSYIVFPIVNGGIIIILSFVSSVFLKEKQSIKGIAGLAVGITAIILLGL